MTSGVRQAGVWKPFKLSVKQGGAWLAVVKAFVKQAGVWRQFYTAFTVAAQSVGATADAPGNASLTWASDGSITDQQGAASYWGTPLTPGIGSGFWLKVHRNSGSGTTSGISMDTWYQLSTNRTVTVTAASNQARNANLTYYISTSASDAGIVSSNTAFIAVSPP